MAVRMSAARLYAGAIGDRIGTIGRTCEALVAIAGAETVRVAQRFAAHVAARHAARIAAGTARAVTAAVAARRCMRGNRADCEQRSSQHGQISLTFHLVLRCDAFARLHFMNAENPRRTTV